MKPIAKALDRWFGRGEASITTPPMDGAFRPNDLLDVAPVALEAPKPDALAVTTQGLLVSLGQSLKRADKLENKTVASFGAEITALTGLPDGGAAAGLVDGRIVFIGGRNDGKTIAGPGCMTALAPARDGALFVASGSAAHGPENWKRDLMEKMNSGSVWRLDLAAQASGLKLPASSPIPTASSMKGTLSSFPRAGAARSLGSSPAPPTAPRRSWRAFRLIRPGYHAEPTGRSGSPCLRRAVSSSSSS